MRRQIAWMCISLSMLIAIGMPTQVLGDELTERVQKDLVALGYDPGNIKGDATDETTAAIAQFQAERDMPVTGEVSPLLAGMISAEVSKLRESPAAGAAAPARDPAALRAAQQACLQERMQAAQESGQKKRGFGRLMSAVTRTASRMGNYDLARTAGDIYSANATAGDLSAAAKDLGLTEDDVAACENPPM